MKTIVVGVDASERAPMVFRTAMDLAAAQDARLVVIRAVSIPIEFPLDAIAGNPETVPSLLVTTTQEGLNKFVAEQVGTRRRRPAVVEARLGTPWQVLCEAAKELHADVLVVGSHGYKFIDRVIGTNAARVVNHAPCSVYVARPTEETKPAR